MDAHLHGDRVFGASLRDSVKFLERLSPFGRGVSDTDTSHKRSVADGSTNTLALGLPRNGAWNLHVGIAVTIRVEMSAVSDEVNKVFVAAASIAVEAAVSLFSVRVRSEFSCGVNAGVRRALASIFHWEGHFDAEVGLAYQTMKVLLELASLRDGEAEISGQVDRSCCVEKPSRIRRLGGLSDFVDSQA